MPGSLFYGGTMESRRLNQAELEAAMHLIPESARRILPERNTEVLGAEFLEEICGVLVWEASGPEGILHSLYVAPEARRLGLGTSLMQLLSREMLRLKVESCDFGFDVTDETEGMLPFLASVGAFYETMELPMGTVTAGEGRAALERFGFGNAGCESVRNIRELSGSETGILSEWMREHTEQSLLPYLSGMGLSQVSLRGGKVDGVLLVSDALRFDYLWCDPESSPKVMAGLLWGAFAQMKQMQVPDDAELTMLLATPESQQLFGKLLEQTGRAALQCGGSYAIRDLV